MDKVKALYDLLEYYGISIALLVAGFFGGLLSLKNKDGLTMWSKMFSVLSGMAISNYLTPLIFEYINVNEGTKYGVGFLLGYSGLEGVQWALLALKKKLKKD